MNSFLWVVLLVVGAMLIGWFSPNFTVAIIGGAMWGFVLSFIRLD